MAGPGNLAGTGPSFDRALHEKYVQDARHYLQLAERVHGPIPRPVDAEYILGDALNDLQRAAADLRLINLENSVTTSEDAWPGKGVHNCIHTKNISRRAAFSP